MSDKLNYIANKICRDITHDCRVVLEMEQGAATVYWVDRDGDRIYFDSADMSIFNQLEYALAEANACGHRM